MACAIDGSTASVEMFQNPGVFHQFFDKLIRAYAAEVVHEHKVATMVPDKEALKDLLHRIASSRWDEYPAVDRLVPVSGTGMMMLAMTERERHAGNWRHECIWVSRAVQDG